MSTRYVLQAGVWLIFLTLFITDVSKSDHSTVIKTTSYALTVLFIAVYLQHDDAPASRMAVTH